MKYPNLILFLMLVSLSSLSACGSKSVKVLDAPWISMKSSSPPQAPESLKKVGPISEKYCHNSFKGSGHVGLIDEVLLQSERKNNLDHIGNVSIYQVNQTCVELTGIGYQN